MWTAGETFGLALGPAVFALILQLGGYRSGSGAVQPDSAVTAIVIGFALLPAVLVLVSLWWLARYRLEADVVEGAHA